MNRKTKRNAKITSCVTGLMLVVSMVASSVIVSGATENTKEETVYVVTESDGSQREVVVSDHIINRREAKKIKDASTLADIENIKGDEKFTRSGNHALSWEADGNDIYYQGTTDKTVPVTMNIKYYLDGKKVTGQDLKGKSGSLKITIDYENHQQVTIDGNAVKVPFIVMTGMLIEDDCLKHISVSGGKVIDDGKKQIVVTVAAPGIVENTGASAANLGFSDHVEITGTAENFEVQDMMTVVTGDLFHSIDADQFSQLNMDQQIAALDDAAKTLTEGTATLYDGIHMMAQQSDALSTGVSKLKNGAQSLRTGTKSALQGSETLAAGATELSDTVNQQLLPGAQQLAAGSNAVAEGVETMAASIGADGSDPTTLVGGAAQLNEGLNGSGGVKERYDNVVAYSAGVVQNTTALMDSLKANGAITEEQYNQITGALDQSLLYQQNMQQAISQLGDGAGALYQGAQTLSAGFYGDGTGLLDGTAALRTGADELLAGIQGTAGSSQSLAEGTAALSKGAADLQKGQEALNSGASELAAGMEQLDQNSSRLIGGIRKLDNGSGELQSGMQQFYHQGIETLVELYNSKLKGTTENLDAMVKAGKAYRTFTLLPDSMAGNVKFVYRTEIMKEEAN